MARDLDQYGAADPDADFDAINPNEAAPQGGQVDPIMNHSFELNDEGRADAVQSTTFVAM